MAGPSNKLEDSLRVAAYTGDDNVIKSAIEDGSVHVNAVDKYGWTMLHVAADNRHNNIITFLLDIGVDANIQDENGITPLYIACYKGHDKIVQLLLDHGVHVDVPDKNGITPLYIACYKGHNKVVQLLLDHGVQVDVQDKDGHTPLYIASQEGYSEIVEVLLKANARTDLTNKDGITPVHIAYYKDHDKVVQVLLDHGVQVDVQDKDGMTPLHIACSHGHDKVVQLLLDHGVQVDVPDKDGKTPLWLACCSGHNKIVQVLLDHDVQMDVPDKDGITPLHIACYHGCDKVVRTLLDHGVQIDVQDKNGCTPLYVVSREGYSEIVEVLLKANARTDLTNKNRMTPLYIACYKDHVKVVQLLLDHNVQMDVSDKDGHSPLYVASQVGNSEIVEVLVKANARTDLTKKDGCTPLYVASRQGYSEIVEMLLKANARTDLTNKNGMTPLYIACYKGHNKIVQLLLDHGVQMDVPDKDGFTPLYVASREGYNEIVEALLNANARSDLTNKEDITPLYIACYKGHDKVVQVLLDNCVQVDVQDKDGCTPLYVASQKGYSEIVEALLKANARTDLTNIDGLTPFHIACYKGYDKVIQVLLDHGVQVDVPDKSGNTPLHYTCYGGSVHAIKFLLSSGQVDPMSKNKRNEAPMELVPPHHNNRFEILKLFEPFIRSQADFPVESFGKVFMCGNTTSGKSSLTAVIMERAKKPANHKFDTSECVTVEPLTAGINAHTFTSHEIGNVVLYDLAGHREYYSSHAAVLENLMLSSPAVFLVLSKLINDKETMRKELYYWFNFIENVSKGMKSSKRSQIIVIGSRLDELTTSLYSISQLVRDVAEKAIYIQEFQGFLPMECHRPGGKGVEQFIVKLSKSCKAVLDQSHKISFYCHVQFSFLQLLQRVAISLEELCALLKEHNDPSLPSEMSVLLEFLTTLSDKGLILFLENNVGQSWVVIDKAALLSDINGVLFAPAAIERVYLDMASNTGIIPLSALKKAFPHHNTDMLVGFLRSLQFCHVIESSTLGDLETNISASTCLPLDKVLFFPALVSAEPPTDIIIENGLGWCLWCPDPNEFLSTRFLHVLLLCLAYTYCLPPRKKPGMIVETNHTVQKLTRRCAVWTNGIYWKNKVEVVVEVSEHNRCVTVLTSNKEMEECNQVFNSVIKKVLSLKEQFCSCTSDEYMIAPDQVSTAHTLEVCKRTLYSIEDVAFTVLTRKEVVRSTDDIAVDIKEIVGNADPFLHIAPLVTKALFNTSNADLPVQDDYLQHIQDVCGDTFLSSVECTHISIKEHCSRLSIFAGRNPLNLASSQLTECDIENASKSVLKKTYQRSDVAVERTSKTATAVENMLEKIPKKLHLQQALAPIKQKWRQIGEGLEISHGTIQSISGNPQYYDDTLKLSEILQKWIDTNNPSNLTWGTIIEVIKKEPVNEPVEAEAILKHKYNVK